MSRGELILSVTVKDCDVQTFRSGGPGGQNQNKRDTGVRIVHRESGAVGESREERSQLQNKKQAWRRMVATPRFQTWLKKKLGGDLQEKAEAARLEDKIQRMVAADLDEENLLWEFHDGRRY